ncbi:unnamed protein product, partial [marine sediment metagenome]
KILLPVLFLVLLASCGQKSKIEISGLVNNANQKYIYLDEMDINQRNLVDSAKIRKKGAFFFRIHSAEPNYYQLRLTSRNFITLLASPGEKISVVSKDRYLPENYEVFGSEGSSLLKKLDDQLRKTIYKTDSISALYKESQENPGFDTIGPQLNDAYTKVIQDQRRFTIRFILENIRSLAAIKALYQKLDSTTYVLYDNKDLQYLKIVADSLKVHYPDSKHTKALVIDLEQGLKRFNALRLAKLIQNSGKEKSLDIALPNPAGYNSVDAPLWFFWAIQQYVDYAGSEMSVWKKYSGHMKAILAAYRNGASFNIRMQENGLIWAGEEGKALTWMDAVVDGYPVTQRKG